MSKQPQKPKSKKVTAVFLADYWGISDTRVRQLAADGIIPEADPKHGYPFKTCTRAYIAYLQQLATQRIVTEGSDKKDELRNEQIQLLRVKRQLAQKSVMYVDTHKLILGATVAAAKSRLLPLPQRLSAEVPAEVKETVHATATKIVHEALQELAGTKLDITPTQPKPTTQTKRTKRTKK